MSGGTMTASAPGGNRAREPGRRYPRFSPRQARATARANLLIKGYAITLNKSARYLGFSASR
jgi:hypothetical protein